MKMKLTAILMLVATLAAFSQQATKRQFEIEKIGTINLSDQAEDWDVSLQHLEAPKPGISGLRAELHSKKLELMSRYPKDRSQVQRTVGGAVPVVGTNFEGNTFQNTPNDNDMAISKGGFIVSVTNSRIHIYDAATQEQLLVRSLHLFSSPADVLGSKYDPKVIYDPNNDRFVMIFLAGFTWETSKIVVGFSQTNDPTADWNVYALPGNPSDNETWSDYPVVGISGKDLYIGINTFLNGSQNNSGFVESCLWQVGLRQGYIGFELITNYYNNILPNNKPIFNICPIPYADESEAENMFLLSNRNTDMQNDTVFILEVTGRVTDPNTTLNVTTILADQPYILPVPADQPGNQWLDTNDGRVLGGYLLNGRIYYVQSCTHPGTGRASIFHGVIDDVAGSPTMVSRIYTQPDLDYGYPNISWTGLSTSDEQSIISFNHSSETVAAGFSAIHVNADLDASERVTVFEGDSYVNVLTDSLERWGDYSGSQRMYNQPGVVWAAGSYGKSNHGHGTRIAQIFGPNAVASVSQVSSVDTEVFPNPFNETLSVTFDLSEPILLRLELFDAEGKLVQILLEDRVKAGTNKLSFNGSLLPAGIYFIIGTNGSEKLFSKQLIKQ
ncbi:MAG: hypothetical protein RL266_196 [Bacteroidota bacterium]|jgi:hypothetical protein